MAGLARQLCVLGATGSVGGAALSIVREQRERFVVAALAADSRVAAMHRLCLEFRPQFAAMASVPAAEELDKLLIGEGIVVDGGAAAVAAAVNNCDTVIAGIAGAGGLSPVLAAAQLGRRILLANKESLVIAGELLMQAARKNGAQILPIDSEHAALFELLTAGHEYARLWLTASGGALRQLPLDKISRATPQQVLAHPTWTMGRKITVDSATMMNKVLEIIEATVLFNAAAEKIGTVIHPQSIVHALVESPDGSMTAQLAMPDMRQPIARMLAWPDSDNAFCTPRPSWRTLSNLSFSEPETARYPCLALAQAALAAGGAAPAMLSAANETAVAQFLAGEIAFGDIYRINALALEQCAGQSAATLEDLRAADEYTRAWAAAL